MPKACFPVFAPAHPEVVQQLDEFYTNDDDLTFDLDPVYDSNLLSLYLKNQHPNGLNSLLNLSSDSGSGVQSQDLKNNQQHQFNTPSWGNFESNLASLKQNKGANSNMEVDDDNDTNNINDNDYNDDNDTRKKLHNQSNSKLDQNNTSSNSSTKNKNGNTSTNGPGKGKQKKSLAKSAKKKGNVEKKEQNTKINMAATSGTGGTVTQGFVPNLQSLFGGNMNLGGFNPTASNPTMNNMGLMEFSPSMDSTISGLATGQSSANDSNAFQTAALLNFNTTALLNNNHPSTHPNNSPIKTTGNNPMVMNMVGNVNVANAKKRKYSTVNSTPNSKSLSAAGGGVRRKSEEQMERRRERNRILARRTRLRKKFYFESLQKQVMELKAENTQLRHLVQKTMKEKAGEVLGKCSAVSEIPAVVRESMGEGDYDATKDLLTKESNGNMQLIKAFQSAQQSFIVTDPSLPDNPIVFATQGFVKLTGYRLDQVLGRNCRFLQGPDTDKKAVDKIAKGIKEGKDTSTCLLNYKADGSTFWNHFLIAALRDLNNNVVYYVGAQCAIDKPIDYEIVKSATIVEDVDDMMVDYSSPNSNPSSTRTVTNNLEEIGSDWGDYEEQDNETQVINLTKLRNKDDEGQLSNEHLSEKAEIKSEKQDPSSNPADMQKKLNSSLNLLEKTKEGDFKETTVKKEEDAKEGEQCDNKETNKECQSC